MKTEIIRIETDLPFDDWYDSLSGFKNDFIVLGQDIDKLTWFATRYMQYLSVKGGTEIAPLYGNLINNLKDFCYQINLSLPVGYRFRADYQPLHDTLLNFETEPAARFLVWNDAQHLFKKNPGDFELVFDALITSAYSNRNGISTIKEDGTRYQVDQRNIFIFHDIPLNSISPLLEKEYYIGSIDEETRCDHKLEFQIVEIV